MKALLIPDGVASSGPVSQPSRMRDGTPNCPEDLGKLEKAEIIQRFLDATKTISKMESREKQVAADEKLIKEKMNRGLNRNQAIAVIERQRKFDQALPKAKTETK